MLQELELRTEAPDFEVVHREALPVCLPPWRENPYGLVSLWDMVKFDAGSVVNSSTRLIQCWQGLKHGAGFTQKGLQDLAYSLGALQQQCQSHGFQTTLNQIIRVQRYFRDESNPARDTISQLLGEIVVRLEEELNGHTFLAVQADHVSYYESQEPLFGQEVHEQFPSARYDITEAGKCYALHRFTACVFHLMRALEIGLRVLADRFVVPSDRQNWHNIIEGIEKKIREISADPNRPTDWKDQQEFFSGAATQFMFVKDAWRNYVAHARDKATEEEAEVIFRSVRAIMQRLATRLHE